MNPLYFSQSYLEARERFLTAAAEHEAHLDSWIHPNQAGPAGEELSIDAAYFGSRQAERVMMLLSGTHGVEGFAGSAVQLALMGEGMIERLPPGIGLLLVHALNPFGFAYLRRVDENNVDLNRNFIERGMEHGIDRGKSHALENNYAELHALLVPNEWEGETRAKADAELEKLALTRGPRTVQAAITGGQWTHPDGIFYGGKQPAWSNTVFHKVIHAYLGQREAVAVIDLHTGLGSPGVAEVIFRARFADGGYDRAQRWYGASVTCSEDQTSSSTEVHGNVHSAVEREIGTTALTAVTLEFGTLSRLAVLNALRGDNWLHTYGHPKHPLAAQLKMAIRDAFYCDNDPWKEQVLKQALDVLQRGLTGLHADPRG